LGLDIYVGSLTRYYSGDWETIVQQLAKTIGLPGMVVRWQPYPDNRKDLGRVLDTVKAWRAQLSKRVRGLPRLDWVETEGPYFTDKPDWDGYLATLLWACRHEHPEHACAQVDLTNVQVDPSYQACFVNNVPRTRFPQIINMPDVWLPVDTDKIFRADDPRGIALVFGSSVALARELDELNAQTWKASSDAIVEWRQIDPNSPDWKELAKRGYSILHYLARLAIDNRLPMIRDY
jgi:hypothetical protein